MKAAASRRNVSVAASKKNDLPPDYSDEEPGLGEREVGAGLHQQQHQPQQHHQPQYEVRALGDSYPFRLVLYMTMVALIILTFSYGFERHLRVELVDQFTFQLEAAAEAIFTAKQKSQLEQDGDGGGGSGGGLGSLSSSSEQQPCPVCGPLSALSLPLSTASSAASVGASHHKITVQDVLDSWRSRHDSLVDALTRMSRELLRSKYGPSPYYVRMDLAFPFGQPGGFVVMELDGDIMPYTTLYFLEQVSAKAWDTCQFILNAGVLLQVDTRGEHCSRKNFQGIASIGEALAFQEYSPKMLHRRMTVGIRGRPGGPLFYVSLINNTANLGPRVGEMDMGPFGLPPEADPCFGRVIRGEEVMERVNRLPVREGGTQIRMLQEFVVIKQAARIEQQQGRDLIKECDPAANIC